MGGEGTQSLISEALETIHAALDEAGEASLSTIGDDELAHLLAEVNVVSARVDALRARITARATLVLTGPGTPNRSAAQLLARSSNADPNRCRHDARIGAWLADFPELAEAFSAGVINHGHLRHLQTADNPRTHCRLVEAQSFLIETAQNLDLKAYGQAVSYWLLAADPDGNEPAEQAARSGCSYHRNADGSVTGRFQLDPVAGQAFTTALAQEAERIYREDVQAERHQTLRQRTSQALVRLISRGAARPDGTVPAPLVSIVMSQTVAEAVVEATASGHTPSQWPTDATKIDGRCEFIDGTPVHPLVAARVLAVAQFRRYVFDSKGCVTEMAVKARRFPKHLRHLLLLESRGRCCAPGCDAPAQWLEADHIYPASKGGATSLANGQMLCGTHNRLKADHTPPREP